MLFYPSKDNDALNRRPFEPDRLTGRAMVNPHYPIRKLRRGTQAIIDSTAFQTMLARKQPWKALDDQLRYETQLAYRMGDPDWHAEAIVHYDQMLGVDEAIDERGRKVKTRGTAESAQPAVEATLTSAQYYASQRHRIRGALAFAAQGINPDQYIDCVLALFDLMQPGDWLALGGFCIIGQRRELIPVFCETVERVLPLCEKKDVARLHILGVTVPGPIAFAATAARSYKVLMSTDSSSPERNAAAFGRSFADGAFFQQYTKEQKVLGDEQVAIPPGCYHPCDLAHQNIEQYHQWTQTLAH